MTIVAPSGAELLDLDGIARREETIRFDLLDQSNNVIGTLAIDRDRPPSLTNDIGATSPRTLSGLTISASDASGVNPLTDRVRPTWVLGAGGAGYEFPMGILLFGDAASAVASWGTTVTGSLVDQTLLLSDVLDQSVSFDAGTVAATALASLAAMCGVVAVAIDPSGVLTGAPIVGLAGRDTPLKVMGLICAAVGLLAPYFDNSGTLVCRTPPNLATAAPDHVYGAGTGDTGRVIAGSISSSDGLLTTPNRYRVRDTSATSTGLVGTFDVPDSAPNSFVNIGRRRTRSEDVQGLADQATADAAARALYAQDSSVFSTLTFSSTPDPRHDTLDVVSFDGVNYIEHVWRLPCSPGSSMQHDVKRIYT